MLKSGCMLNSPQYIRDGEVAASLERVRDADGKSKGHEPCHRWRCMSVVAINDCPVRSMHPQPVSFVQPFSPPGCHRFEGGLEDIGFGDPAAAAAATSACSHSRTARDESRMG
jgi:hypothetical protein